MSNITNILVIDDHEYYRKGLVLALEEFESVKVIGQTYDIIESIKIIEQNSTDILFMGIIFSKIDQNIETANKLQQINHSTKIVAMVDYVDVESIQRIIDANVFVSIVLKNIDSEELTFALKNSTNGKSYYSQELAGILSRRSADDTSVHITKQEIEILQLVAQGLTNREIANKLHLNVRTVANHRANMHKKTGVKRTVQLISWGIKNKYLENM